MSKETLKERQDESIKKAKIKLYKRAIEWKNAFGTSDGEQCLKLLRAEFYDIPSICNINPEVTKARAAQRDLVRFIIEQLEFEGE